MILKTLKYTRFGMLSDDVLDACMDIEGLILAGGAVRDTLFGARPSDYDMFLTHDTDVEKVKAYFLEREFVNVFTCPQGKLFTYMKGEDFKKPETCVKVQIIVKRTYDDVQDLISSFDFSATYFGLEWDDDADQFLVHTSRQAIKDVRKKQLSLVNLEYPSSTINRLYKYRAKGYYVGHVIKEIVQMIASMDGYNPDDDELYID